MQGRMRLAAACRSARRGQSRVWVLTAPVMYSTACGLPLQTRSACSVPLRAGMAHGMNPGPDAQ